MAHLIVSQNTHTLFLHLPSPSLAALRCDPSSRPLRRFMFHWFAQIPSCSRPLTQFPPNRKRGCSDLPLSQRRYVHPSRSLDLHALCGPLVPSDVTPVSLAQENHRPNTEDQLCRSCPINSDSFRSVIDLSTSTVDFGCTSQFTPRLRFFSLPDIFSSRRTPHSSLPLLFPKTS